MPGGCSSSATRASATPTSGATSGCCSSAASTESSWYRPEAAPRRSGCAGSRERRSWSWTGASRAASPDVVRSDSREGAFELGRLLVSLGHRTTAVLTGSRNVSTADDRVAGLQRGTRRGGTAATARRLLGRVHDRERPARWPSRPCRRPRRPTALFAANNFIAIGVLHALDGLEIRVPEDVCRRRLRRPAARDGDVPLPDRVGAAGRGDGPAQRRRPARSPVHSETLVRGGRPPHEPGCPTLEWRRAGRPGTTPAPDPKLGACSDDNRCST